MKDAKPMLERPARKQDDHSPSQWPRYFVLSAGGILALAGANHLLEALGTLQVLDLPDPVFGIAFRYLELLAGAVELLVAWLCLLTRRRQLGMGFLFFLTTNFLAYRAALWTVDWPHPWVFVSRLTDFLNVSPRLTDGILLGLALYLLTGSAILLFLPRKVAILLEPDEYFKIRCPSCGGKTAFTIQWVGRTVACPHCGSPLPLSQPAN